MKTTCPRCGAPVIHALMTSLSRPAPHPVLLSPTTNDLGVITLLPHTDPTQAIPLTLQQHRAGQHGHSLHAAAHAPCTRPQSTQPALFDTEVDA